MSVTLPGTGSIVETVDGTGGAQRQVVAVAALPEVALDPTTLAALETVSIANFPATQPVSLAAPVALDSAALAALESITVQSSALPTGASTEATLAALNTATGARADAAASTDAGTFSLISLLKRLLGKFPALGQALAAASQPVVIASDQSALPVAVAPAAYVDRSGTITAGGTAQQLMPANSARRGFFLQNNSTADLWINPNAAAVASQPSLKVPAGALYESPFGGAPAGAISIIGATTGQAFSAREF